MYRSYSQTQRVARSNIGKNNRGRPQLSQVHQSGLEKQIYNSYKEIKMNLYAKDGNCCKQFFRLKTTEDTKKSISRILTFQTFTLFSLFSITFFQLFKILKNVPTSFNSRSNLLSGIILNAKDPRKPPLKIIYTNSININNIVKTIHSLFYLEFKSFVLYLLYI